MCRAGFRQTLHSLTLKTALPKALFSNSATEEPPARPKPRGLSACRQLRSVADLLAVLPYRNDGLRVLDAHRGNCFLGFSPYGTSAFKPTDDCSKCSASATIASSPKTPFKTSIARSGWRRSAPPLSAAQNLTHLHQVLHFKTSSGCDPRPPNQKPPIQRWPCANL
jgi:hypothetical protein